MDENCARLCRDLMLKKSSSDSSTLLRLLVKDLGSSEKDNLEITTPLMECCAVLDSLPPEDLKMIESLVGQKRAQQYDMGKALAIISLCSKIQLSNTSPDKRRAGIPVKLDLWKPQMISEILSNLAANNDQFQSDLLKTLVNQTERDHRWIAKIRFCISNMNIFSSLRREDKSEFLRQVIEKTAQMPDHETVALLLCRSIYTIYPNRTEIDLQDRTTLVKLLLQPLKEKEKNGKKLSYDEYDHQRMMIRFLKEEVQKFNPALRTDPLLEIIDSYTPAPRK
jgi:hypothetical protein